MAALALDTQIFNKPQEFIKPKKLKTVAKLALPKPKKKSGIAKFINLAKGYAKIVDSREAIYRAVLDLVAFDIPAAIAASRRNTKNFIETCFEVGMSFGMLAFAPTLTKYVAKLIGKFSLKKSLSKYTDKLLLFHMPELRDIASMKKGVERILDEEVQDQERIAQLYKEVGNEKGHKRYKDYANEIKSYFADFKISDSMKSTINKLKRKVILTESLIEGGIWGGFGFILRGFRKFVLKESRFTGTKGYLSDEESKKLGESGDLNLFQKVVGAAMMVLSPITNKFLLDKTANKEAVSKSKFLKTAEKHIDMVHGTYPNLGLIFTYTVFPKWLGTLITSQGWLERTERLLKILLVMSSYWFGHRFTNGILADHYDKKLAKKYGVERGILVEKESLGHRFKEPARIHHVMKKTEDNKALQKEATDKHPSILYLGFGLHSALITASINLVNWIIKKLALKSAKKL